jgi:hypothetical protein
MLRGGFWGPNSSEKRVGFAKPPVTSSSCVGGKDIYLTTKYER